jgi:hypothetical protein
MGSPAIQRTVSYLAILGVLTQSIAPAFADCIPIQDRPAAKEIYVLKDFDPTDINLAAESPSLARYCEKKLLSTVLANYLPKLLQNTQNTLNPPPACRDSTMSPNPQVAEFSSLTQKILTADNYQYFFLNDDEETTYDDFLNKFVDIQNRQVYHAKKKKESLDATQVAVAKKAATVVVFNGPAAILGKTVEKVAAASLKKASELRKQNKPREKLALTQLLPSNSKKIALVRTATGALLLLLGVSGIVAGVLTLGASGVVTGPLGAGISVTGNVIERAAFRSGAHREKYFTGPARAHHLNVRPTVISKMGLQSTDQAFEQTLHTELTDVLAQGVGSTGDSTDAALAAIPLLGSVYQVTNGAKKLYQGFHGYEKGHEFLLDHELNFKDLVNSQVNHIKKDIQSALFLAKGLDLAQVSDGEDPLHFLSQTNCLCEALAWEDQFQAQSEKAFRKRIQYLETRIARKAKKKQFLDKILGDRDLKNLGTTLKLIEEFSSELERQNEELQRHYQTLAGGLTIAGDPQFEALTLNISPRLTTEKEKPQLREALEWNSRRLGELDQLNIFLLNKVSEQIETKLGGVKPIIVIEQTVDDPTPRNFELETMNGDADTPDIRFKSYRDKLQKNQKEQKRVYRDLQKDLQKVTK